MPLYPHQNGLAERKNQHLIEVIWVSLIGANAPVSYWGEALSFIAYLINIFSYTILDFQTPSDVLAKPTSAPTMFNVLPRVFGCVTFIHLHKEKQTKLESLLSNAYLWDIHLHKKGIIVVIL